MQPRSYIEDMPKELGLELLDRMTTEQVEKLLETSPLLFRRYKDYFEERLEAEIIAREAYNERWQDAGEITDELKSITGDPNTINIQAILLNPRATRFMGLPYRDREGRGYYSLGALDDWTDLFIKSNKDSENFLSLTPKEQTILGLPERVRFDYVVQAIWDDMEFVAKPSLEILTYLEEEERELDRVMSGFD